MLLLTIAHAALFPARASDWPNWRGSNRDGISDETNLNWSWPTNGPKTVWKGAIGKGFSSLVIARGRLYAMGNQANIDTVFCLDAASGKEIWKHSYACLLDPLSYEGGPSSTPAVDGNRVYTLSKSGHLFCLDAQSGGILWSNKFEVPPTTSQDYKVWWGYAGSPLIAGDRLILSVGTAGMAMDKLTGKVVWDNGPGRPGYSSPVPFKTSKQSGFAFLSGHEIVAVKANSGDILWKISWRTTWDQNAPDVLVADEQLFISTGHGVGSALFDLAEGQPVQTWRNKNMRSELSTPVLWKGALYGFDTKSLVCLDWKTGDRKWVGEETGKGSLILVDGKLIALQEDGILVIVEATSEAYRPVAKAQILSGRCWSAPSLADGRLYARNSIGDLVCLDLRK